MVNFFIPLVSIGKTDLLFLVFKCSSSSTVSLSYFILVPMPKWDYTRARVHFYSCSRAQVGQHPCQSSSFSFMFPCPSGTTSVPDNSPFSSCSHAQVGQHPCQTIPDFHVPMPKWDNTHARVPHFHLVPMPKWDNTRARVSHFHHVPMPKWDNTHARQSSSFSSCSHAQVGQHPCQSSSFSSCSHAQVGQHPCQSSSFSKAYLNATYFSFRENNEKFGQQGSLNKF